MKARHEAPIRDCIMRALALNRLQSMKHQPRQVLAQCARATHKTGERLTFQGADDLCYWMGRGAELGVALSRANPSIESDAIADDAIALLVAARKAGKIRGAKGFKEGCSAIKAIGDKYLGKIVRKAPSRSGEDAQQVEAFAESVGISKEMIYYTDTANLVLGLHLLAGQPHWDRVVPLSFACDE